MTVKTKLSLSAKSIHSGRLAQFTQIGLTGPKRFAIGQCSACQKDLSPHDIVAFYTKWISMDP